MVFVAVFMVSSENLGLVHVSLLQPFKHARLDEVPAKI
jgi:hypothetical protein